MNFEAFLQQRDVPFEKHMHPVTYTAQALANAEHVSGYMVAKPVVVRSNAGFTMCAVAAPRHVDLKRVAELLHDPNVRLATESEMARLFPDCELGAEPPLGALYGLQTLMDEHLRTDEFLVMQSGSHREAVKLRRADFEKLAEPVVAPIAG